ncbi:MAG: invasion associated locus B family protein [Hyphomicrobiaceae bacterium]
MTRHGKITCAIFLLLTVVGAGVPLAGAAELVGAHSDWKTYRHGAGDEKLCFAVSEPGEANPKGLQRQSPHVYVTAWPKAGVKAEISVLIGAALKKGVEIKADVDGSQFDLFPDGDRAYVSNANEEVKLLDAMRRGRSLTITATTASGQQTRDVYSLSGVTAAVQAMSSDCS